MKLVLTAVTVLVCLSGLSNSSWDAEAAPNPIPLVTVDTALDIYEVRALPFSSTQLTISGNLTAENYCGGRITISLTSEIDSGWPISFYPTTIPFINPADVRFLVFVTVPPGASTEPRDLIIKATAKSPGLGLFGAITNCSIIPSQVYTSSIEPIGSPCVVGEDGTARFPMRIWNTGNVADVYTVDLDMGGTAIEGWDGPLEVLVPPRSFVENNITLHYDEPIEPIQLWSVELSIRSSQTGVQRVNSIEYIEGPSSTRLWVFEKGPAVAPVLDIDLSAGVTILIIQLALIISVLTAYGWRSRSRAS